MFLENKPKIYKRTTKLQMPVSGTGEKIDDGVTQANFNLILHKQPIRKSPPAPWGLAFSLLLQSVCPSSILFHRSTRKSMQDESALRQKFSLDTFIEDH